VRKPNFIIKINLYYVKILVLKLKPQIVSLISDIGMVIYTRLFNLRILCVEHYKAELDVQLNDLTYFH
jgi:hypothetical protein